MHTRPNNSKIPRQKRSGRPSRTTTPTTNPSCPSKDNSDDESKCNSLRNALFPAVNYQPRPPLSLGLLSSKHDMRRQTRPVTTQEVHTAISQLKYGTSVGSDGISYTTLRHHPTPPSPTIQRLPYTCSPPTRMENSQLRDDSQAGQGDLQPPCLPNHTDPSPSNRASENYWKPQ